VGVSSAGKLAPPVALQGLDVLDDCGLEGLIDLLGQLDDAGEGLVALAQQSSQNIVRVLALQL
jgi:hypothetical protein